MPTTRNRLGPATNTRRSSESLHTERRSILGECCYNCHNRKPCHVSKHHTLQSGRSDANPTAALSHYRASFNSNGSLSTPNHLKWGTASKRTTAPHATPNPSWRQKTPCQLRPTYSACGTIAQATTPTRPHMKRNQAHPFCTTRPKPRCIYMLRVCCESLGLDTNTQDHNTACLQHSCVPTTPKTPSKEAQQPHWKERQAEQGCLEPCL